MKRVVVTGGNGKIAAIIAKYLAKECEFTFLDRHPMVGLGPVRCAQVDIVKERSRFIGEFVGMDVAIHLAWNNVERWDGGEAFPPNLFMAENFFDAAREARVKKLIVASSIHAVNWRAWSGEGRLTPEVAIPPLTSYGHSKLLIEKLCRLYAEKYGMDVTCIRFGGVDPSDIVRHEVDYRRIMLTAKDCAACIKCGLEAKPVYGNFSVFYAVSDNTTRPFSWENKWRWAPQDNCEIS